MTYPKGFEILWNIDITLYCSTNEVLGITKDFLYPINSKIYGKELRSKETSL